MKVRLLFILSLCFLLAHLSLHAQPAPVVPWKIESTSPDGEIQYGLGTGLVKALKGVLIKYMEGTPEAAEMTATEATLNRQTGEATATGNVVLHRDGQTWKTEHLEYNFNTRRIKAAKFRGGAMEKLFSGSALEGSLTNKFYTATDAKFTTDDVADPDVFIAAKRVNIMAGDHIEFFGATVNVAGLPVAYLPYYKRSLKSHPWNVHTEPGYRSQWGAYLLNSVRWPGSERLGGEMHLDYRSARGFGFGPELRYNLGALGTGHIDPYFTFDDDPRNDSRGSPLNKERQRLRMAHRAGTSPDFTVTGVLDYESDEYMRRDFFQRDYRDNAQPRSFLEVNRNWTDYNLNLLAQPRLNDHFGTVERLPDLRFTGLRHQLGNSPLYYDQESSLAYLRRKYRYDTSPYLGGMRADSLHQVYLPKTYFGWLHITPRIGGRWTHYGETDGSGSTLDARDRLVFNTGAEVSAKASKFFPEARSTRLDLNGLRHVVEPSVNYVFVPRPNRRPSELPQYDYEVTGSRLLPILYPDYNAIDQVDSQNVLRLSLRNRLQTQRKPGVEDFVDWHVYTDWRLHPESNQHSFADLFSGLTLRPRTWMGLSSDLRYDVDDSMWRLINNYVSITPDARWSLRAGHYYYLEPGVTSKVDRSSTLYASWGYRFNEDWSFGTSQYYDAKRGSFSDHSYTLYRDFRSWTGYLDVRFLDSQGTSSREDAFQISLNFSLKSMPRAPRQ